MNVLKHNRLMKINMLIIGLLLISVFFTDDAKAQTQKRSKIFYLSDTSVNFDGLVEKFRGKIIYIDIWATWCSPCRQELRNAKSVKGFEQFASKNDVVILYICCDKTGGQWKQFINANELAGYHILANNKLDKDFHTTFSSVQKRKGMLKRSFYIPRHMIVDRDGAVADTTAASQCSKLLYTQINRLLNETARN